jgi:hypothetical protein
MATPGTIRKLVAALTLPAYLLAFVTCACVTAAAEPAPPDAREADSCCPGHDRAAQDSRPVHHPGKHAVCCTHCDLAQLNATGAVKLPTVPFGHWIIPPAAALTVATASRAAHPALRPFCSGSSASPPSILRRKCSLLI